MSRGATQVRLYRDERGLTQAEMARRAEIDPWYYAKIERGVRKPGRAVALRLSRASEGYAAVSDWDEPGTERKAS